MWKYILKRIGLMFVTFAIIFVMSFVLIRLLPDTTKCDPTNNVCQQIAAWKEALGYNKPILVQLWLYIGGIFSKWDWGIGFNLYPGQNIADILAMKLPYTVYVNIFASLIAMPIGLLLGVFAALKKNKWQDQVISVLVMLVISVPSFVYCFIVQYFLCFKWHWFPIVTSSGSNFFSPSFFASYMPAIICLGLGTVAGLTRYTRAELTEVLTSDFMLLARAKGLTRGQATWRHALRNSMVPIFPMILGEFISVLGGSLIIEQFFAIPGVGALYLQSVETLDYNFFMFISMFYVAIGLAAGLIVDLSYGWVDPRIRMGAR